MTPIDWLMGDDTGISSKTIFSVMMDCAIDRADVPYDPADFGRCYRLLKQFPEWESRLGEVSSKYPAWTPMVDSWSELSLIYEAKDYTKLYKKMQELVDAGRILDGWKQTHPGCWTKTAT